MFKELFINDYLKLNDEKKSSDEMLENLIKIVIRKCMKLTSDKKPQVNSHILRI